jgi:hypothetical protein
VTAAEWKIIFKLAEKIDVRATGHLRAADQINHFCAI